jgi:cyclopropane fatty-acyl-phospholipid synthase-like methyltransferase
MSSSRVNNVQTVARHYDQFFDMFDRDTLYANPGKLEPPPIINIGYWAHGATTAREAQEAFVHFAAAHLPGLEGSRVLDVGCGLAGPASILAARYGAQVDGITIVEKQVTWARRFLATHGMQDRVHVHQGSAMDIPFPDSTFDTVFSLEAAHCFIDKRRFLAEARRVLRPGGRLLLIDITATTHDPLFTWQPALKLQLITADDWRKLFEAGGLRIDDHALIGKAVYPGYRRWIARTAHQRRQQIFSKLDKPGASVSARTVAHLRAWVQEFVFCRSVLPMGSRLKLREYAFVLAHRPQTGG